MAATLHQVVEEIKDLTLAEKERVKELTEKMIIEEERDEFRRAADEARTDYKAGKLKFGTAQEVLNRLNADKRK